MARTNVYAYDNNDGGDGKTLAGWFDPEKAELFKEETRWDGNNNVSVHVGKWNHQALFLTSGGRWVLNSWSQWQGSEEVYEFVSESRAREWLLVNEDDDAVARLFGEVEEERGPGRPEIGKPVNIRLGDDLLAKVDVEAHRRGTTRADLLRELVSSGLAFAEAQRRPISTTE